MTAQIPDTPFVFLDDLLSGVQLLTGFNPSMDSIREQRAREQADRIVGQLTESLTKKGFFPEEGKELVFALLIQLPEWPESVRLNVVNERGEVLESYLKGTDVTVVEVSVTLVRGMDGELNLPVGSGESVNDPEPLFRNILRQLPGGSRLGYGGSGGSNSDDDRIVVIREQMLALAKVERTRLFDAVLADDTHMKSEFASGVANPFLPFWRQTPEYQEIVGWLQALAPQMPVARVYTLLEQSPLSEEEARAFIDAGELTEAFEDALSFTMQEWLDIRGLDGVLHTRTYNDESDALAREHAASLLKTQLNRELTIIERGQLSEATDTHIVLRHNGDGAYSLEEVLDDGIPEFGTGTDSFYRAIGRALQPHERELLGMHGEADVTALRALIGEIAIETIGGWFGTKISLKVEDPHLPEWMRNASTQDKQAWNAGLQDYKDAMEKAQTPRLLDVSQYSDPEQLQEYVRTQLKQHLSVEFGLTLDPDQVFVEITKSDFIADLDMPVETDLGLRGGELKYVTTRRSLTQLCLENIPFEDLSYWVLGHIIDSERRPVEGLSKTDLFHLVRELNVAQSYKQFLEQRLLTSAEGQWSRDRYTQIMRAQMSLDALEAKMANDFNRGRLPGDNADRGYKWVKAVLDHPIDDGGRPLVDGHSIQVQQLTINERSLDGVLIFGPESRDAVSSIVLYTPHVDDGVHFHELSGLDQVQRQLEGNPQYLAALEILRKDGITPVGSSFRAAPISGDLYNASYDYEVRRALAGVDARTTSNVEANLKSAWDLACMLVDVAIEFAPYKVRLPIAAGRSLYALTRAAVEAASGNSDDAIVHLSRAAMLLTDGLPGPKRSRVKTPDRFLDPKMALTTVPEGLKLRNDGIYKGFYEAPNTGGFSRFYATDNGKWFSVSYHTGLRSWQVADARMMSATYRMSVHLNKQGRLLHSPPGAGGGRDKVPKVAKARANRDLSPDGSSNDSFASSSSDRVKRYRLDTDGFFESSEFKKAQKEVRQDDLKAAVEKAVSKYHTDGSTLHQSKGGLSLDLPRLGNNTGRGKFRLILRQSEKGVLKCVNVTDPH
ncbi:MAG: dermonecrotic toxin domain-containing protein [Pseudomonas sp.]